MSKAMIIWGRKMAKAERMAERMKVLQKLKEIADYCEVTECIKCMFYKNDDCILNYIPSRKNDIDNYVKEQMKELGGL